MKISKENTDFTFGMLGVADPTDIKGLAGGFGNCQTGNCQDTNATEIPISFTVAELAALAALGDQYAERVLEYEGAGGLNDELGKVVISAVDKINLVMEFPGYPGFSQE